MFDIEYSSPLPLKLPRMPLPPPLPSDQAVEYRSRTSALEQEKILRLEAGNLLVLRKDAPVETLPLAALTEIRLRFFPTRFQANRFECLLRWQNGRRMKICSQFFAGMADFHDQAPSYHAWIEELHRLTPLVNPTCQYLSGIGMVRYLINAIVTIGMALLLIALMILMFASIPAIAIVKLVILIFYIPILIKWLRRNKPGTYPPTNIPAKVLP